MHPQFVVASIAYTILSDEEKRREYDESGEVDDEDDLASKSGTEQWKDYFSNLFPKVTTKDIDAFEGTPMLCANSMAISLNLISPV